MQIRQTRSTICDSNTDALHRSPSHTNPNRDYRFNLHEGRRKNSLQQWVGVTINTLMISRVQREKASGLRRLAHPSECFRDKSDTTTSEHATPQYHHTGALYRNPQHWFGYGTKDVFRNTTRRVEPGYDDRRSRQPGKNWTGFAGWGQGAKGKTVGCVWLDSVLWKYFVSNARVMWSALA